MTLESPDPVPAGPQVTPSGADERTGLLFSVNLVFLSQIVIYGLAFGLRVVLARGLGDDGLGTYSLFFNAVLVAGGILNLGVGLGNIYFLNKGQYSYETLLSGITSKPSSGLARRLGTRGSPGCGDTATRSR